MTWLEGLRAEPWRHDFFTTLRRLERSRPEQPRIGHAATRREDYAKLGQNPFFEFPASNLEQATDLGDGRWRILVKFLGLLGPQGALPLTTNEEAKVWLDARDDSFVRFLDLFNHRPLQLFYRAWADSRPIAQHERPAEDRFAAYIGSTIGLGTAIYRDLDTVPDAQKLAHAGLAGPAAKSAVRLEQLFLGVLGLRAEVEEFVGSRLPVEPEDRTRIGGANAGLGSDVMLGATFFSVSDKIRIRLHVADLAEYEKVLPVGALAEPIADLVYFYLGDLLEWEVEPALPAREIRPMRLGRAGRIGWTSWLAPKVSPDDTSERIDARFDLAERLRARRAKG
ncbi:type VI secretion system baseplate subunit TssG [Siculibacillus lacustris]|uniref:Type VI secretion system baseplate subunit TssG n=1 Tax=Siculibacillus lacustris TaxID=1549641 RepID=A0A4Q9VP74_9HYPH|nr:type VI secretion system baseplate subunit TssG [Siculibacillus lacustris]TBW36602.1 type VI secretion system baseplate subunit TssG [Siculibacillus lacustris]